MVADPTHFCSMIREDMPTDYSLFQVCLYSLPSILGQLSIFVERVGNMPCSLAIYSMNKSLGKATRRILFSNIRRLKLHTNIDIDEGLTLAQEELIKTKRAKP